MLGTTNESNRVTWVKEKLKAIPAGGRILDAGAGEQRFKPFCEHLDYVAQDFGQYDGAGNETGLQMGAWDNSGLDIISDITAIPEADASFDAILCTEVLEHLPSPIDAIREFSRLLKDRGILICTAPFCSLTHFAPYHYYSGFNRYFYETHLPENEIDIEELMPNGNYFEYLAQEINRLAMVTESYSGVKLGWLERRAQRRLLQMLDRASKTGPDSSELLCYGYHILARRRVR